jgi:L-lysine 6-transaminase
MAVKPLSKAEVNRLKPGDVHNVLSKLILADGFDIVYDMDKSHGMYLHDSRTGKEYLDCFSMFASWPVTHNHPKLTDPKFREELGKVALYNPANSDIYTVQMAQFAATFHRVAMPPEFKHLFFVQGGAQAVENALKTAMDWKVRKNLAAGQGERGKSIIHFKEAFHGRTGYTMSMTNTTDPRKYLYFALWDWPRVENPKAHFPLDGENLTRTKDAEARSLGQIRALLTSRGPDIAAIILEPIQGEGGDNHFRPEFWKELRKLADEFEVLLIADEVQSGMGLTGKMWAHQYYGITPDIVTFGKKAQVCGLIATGRIDEVKDNVFVMSSRINSTWGGNLVDMVRSRRFLEIIEEDKLVENAATVGAYLVERLQDLQKKHPQRLFNIRGKGLMVAFDAFTPDYASKIQKAAYEKNFLILLCGSQSVRFRPPLDMSKKDVDLVVGILENILIELGPAGKSRL